MFDAYFVAIILAGALYIWKSHRNSPDLSHIPTVGFSTFPLSYISAVKWLFCASSMLQEGYDKYPSGIYKIANLNRWFLVVTGSRMVEELRKAPDDVMSFIEAANEMVQLRYTLGKGIVSDSYHVTTLGTQLTRNIQLIFPAVYEEMVASIHDNIPETNSEWVQVPALGMAMQVISRSSSRIFVGLPLCRNVEFNTLNIGFSREVLTAAILVSMFPTFLRPIAARLLTSLPSTTRRMQKFLLPLIRERERKAEMSGDDYPDKPNDLLTWLMNEAKGDQKTVKDITSRILAVNFAAIHTASMTFTHALYHLAANPEHIEPMRAEISSIVRREGWTKNAVDKMRKVDSFLKESTRFSNLRMLSMMRKTTKPHTFSDGTYIPEGTFIFAASEPTHYDPKHYAHPEKFDGFRFSKLAEQQEPMAEMGDAANPRYQLVTTTTDYLTWGYGRRACPGRFFAAVEMKLMLAHLVMNYDVRLEDGAVARPKDWVIEANCLPNASGKVEFRRRRKL